MKQRKLAGRWQTQTVGSWQHFQTVQTVRADTKIRKIHRLAFAYTAIGQLTNNICRLALLTHILWTLQKSTPETVYCCHKIRGLKNTNKPHFQMDIYVTYMQRAL